MWAGVGTSGGAAGVAGASAVVAASGEAAGAVVAASGAAAGAVAADGEETGACVLEELALAKEALRRTCRWCETRTMVLTVHRSGAGA